MEVPVSPLPAAPSCPPARVRGGAGYTKSMWKKKLNPRGPKKRKLVTSLQTCGEGGGQAVRQGQCGGVGRRHAGVRRPHLQLPEHEMRVEVELEGTQEFQLL